MNKLYEKIYEAVNTGIQKALIIDPEQDVSICWQGKKIQSNVNIMNYYVKELMADNIDSYEYILKCNKETGQKYQVKNFDNFIEIFNKIPKNNINLNWMNLSDVLCIITSDDLEIPFNEYDNHNAEFIKIKNSSAGHDIIFHKDLLVPPNKQNGLSWNKEYVRQQYFDAANCISCTYYHTANVDDVKNIAIEDFDGYNNTYNNLNIHDNIYDNYPAFKYCMSLNNDYPEYKAYLPSIGELYLVIKNFGIFNYVLQKIGGICKINDEPIKLCDFWSSTEEDYDAAYIINGGMVKDMDAIAYDYKCHLCHILPFFKKK